MAMIICAECGAKISDKGRVCPNCGYPVPQQKVNSRPVANTIFAIRMVALAIGVIFTIIFIVAAFSTKHQFDMVLAKKDRQNMGVNWSEQWHQEKYGDLEAPDLSVDYTVLLQKDFLYCALYLCIALVGYIVALDLDKRKFLKTVKHDEMDN